MRSPRIQAALVLLLFVLCTLAFGEPAIASAGAGAEPSGRLELTVLSGAEDVCAKCTVMATNMSTGQTATKTVVIAGPIMPDEFIESDFEDLFGLDTEGGHPQAADVDLE